MEAAMPVLEAPPNADNYKLESHSQGPLTVWKWPVQGRQYVLASDVAGGSVHSDMCVATVLDAEDCSLVAALMERLAPIPWGKKVARLGWLYNEALLAFEVWPSAHGLSASDAARTYGYGNFYLRTVRNRSHRTPTQTVGWATDGQSKPLMIDRVKEALEQRYEVPWRFLILQLKKQRWDPNNSSKMYDKSYDDAFVAYAIALMVRDDAWQKGQLRKHKPALSTDTERYWATFDRHQAMRDRAATRGRFSRRNLGI